MFTSDPHHALVVAHDRGRQRAAEAAAERLRTARNRYAIAALLRRGADRLDRTPLAPRPA